MLWGESQISFCHASKASPAHSVAGRGLSQGWNSPTAESRGQQAYKGIALVEAALEATVLRVRPPRGRVEVRVVSPQAALRKATLAWGYLFWHTLICYVWMGDFICFCASAVRGALPVAGVEPLRGVP